MKILKNRTVLGILCIVMSLIICFAVTPLFNNSLSQTSEIVRLTKDVPAGTQISESMLQTVVVGSHNLPEAVLRNGESVVGKYATADLFAGDYLLPTKLSNAPAAENEYLYSLDGSKQAMSVTIRAFALGLSGKLKSGDIVSVIAPDYGGSGETVIPAELQYVEVISVTASSGYDANTGDQRDAGSNGAAAQDESKELPATVTLLVTPEQSKRLAALEDDGNIHLSLVYRGTGASAAKFIEAQDAALAELFAPQEKASAESEAAYAEV